jgi:hypothetical protein
LLQLQADRCLQRNFIGGKRGEETEACLLGNRLFVGLIQTLAMVKAVKAVKALQTTLLLQTILLCYKQYSNN